VRGEHTARSTIRRAVPLAREAFVALDQLSRRERFTGPDDFLFCGPAGDPIDDSALRRRYRAARDAARLPPLPFHHLRHTSRRSPYVALTPPRSGPPRPDRPKRSACDRT
ncbi:MAG: tyrosine-type recombinase/integrase, partial [Solirubrobacteraceae bacterium]